MLSVSLLSSYASTKYVPAPQEPVIGIVSARQGEGWIVDIGSAHRASLDWLAFELEGANKRNRPNLKVCEVLIMLSQIARVIDVRLILSSVPEFLSPVKTWNHRTRARMFGCADAQRRKFLWRRAICSLKISQKCVIFFINGLCSRRVF